ncbi:NTF2 fold immunity protein [Tenacibaculum sp. MAR_2009_124]|uniref:NTF2 fold immunity protein n=1 Tax=Tenacibaculum sp. MAR_2009_124 TaxID=1250059 RepID=UPI00089A52A1|nr:NTF2 fold immunity protein [Tenacibaculum sp. MAR_2009_124]SEC18976.1 NTF2 fold immunity protein [Tenacibaculum sp. MAR_2009_124]
MFSIFSNIYFAKRSSSPKNFVNEFIKDYHKWNNTALKKSGTIQDSINVINEAKENYSKKIVEKYCHEGFEGQPISFSDDTAHHPKKEVITSENVKGNEAIVLTKMNKMHDFEVDYEYRLIKKNKRWYLSAVDYVDGNCKWPCL